MISVKELKKGTLLYHASYKIVDEIDFSKCRDGLDFGKGFYLTTSKEQAEHFVKNSVGRALLDNKISKQKYGFVNTFLYVENTKLNIKIFENANREWLHFIAYNRNKGKNDKVNNKKYDIVGGKIANDFTARTIATYLSGGYGEIGSKAADELAIKLLLPNKLKDQYCFLSNKSLDNIIYKESYKYEF